MSADFTVLSQSPHTAINPSGRGFITVWEIAYRVDSGPAKGTTGMLEVPDSDHNADYVGKAIEDKISSLHAIASLGNTTSGM